MVNIMLLINPVRVFGEWQLAAHISGKNKQIYNRTLILPDYSRMKISDFMCVFQKPLDKII